MRTSEKNITETQIINAAKQVFLEKGFTETSMSDIAIRAGINRPALHYYFRTKERMFDAVFDDIANSFIPKVQDVFSQETPFEEKITKAVDIYFNIMKNKPELPIFITREMQRDPQHLVETFIRLNTWQYVSKIKDVLTEGMKNGKIKEFPIEFVLYTFYGMLFAPFLYKPMADIVFKTPNSDFSEKLLRWKEHVIRQLIQMLCNPS